MAVVRRISIVSFKEIVLEIPRTTFGNSKPGEDYVVIPPSATNVATGFTANTQNQPQRQLVGTYGLDEWGFFINGKQILPDNTNDTNGDGIPDYLSLDINNDGTVDGQDGFGSQDFVGVVKRTLLLAKIRYTDYYDQYKTVNQIYDDLINGVPVNSNFSEPNGWVVIAESKPSFYYEQCGTSYGSNFYFGRVPVSFNYFDLDDIWIDENANGSWPLVSGEGTNPLEVVGNVNVRETNQVVAARTGFDWNFGPDLEDMPNRLELKFIQQYVPFVINEVGRPLFPNMRRTPQNLATIKTVVSPVNLHIASRFDILDNTKLNETAFSTKPFQSQFPNLTDNIEFRDGAKKRWGTPRYAIPRGFLINGVKYSGTCIPVPGEVEEDKPVTTTSKRNLVSIRDVLSGKVKMDGTNYIRGVVTAHFTFPIMSATLQDIADIYYAYYDQSKLGAFLSYSEFGISNEEYHISDPLTFAREMRSVVYVQDETAGMELLGTDFYSTEGLEYQTSPGAFAVSGKIFTGFKNSFNVSSIDDNLRKEINEVSFPSEWQQKPMFDPFSDGAIGGRPGGANFESLSGNIPIKNYWETDTGYLPERYHFKVGDFIEIYNLNILRRPYAPRSCKIVNNEYKIIPNNVDDVMKFFEDNGYIKDVTLQELYSLPLRNKLSYARVSETLKWQKYDYSEENSIHNTEHCLVRVKQVAFGNTDALIVGGSLLVKENQMTIYRNDQSPSIFPGKTFAPEFDDWGYRFEPGRKYVIFDASSPTPRQNAVGRYRAFLYNAPSTEMSKYLLPLPGKNTDLSKEYTDWLKLKRKFDPSGSRYVDYKWPLDIIGIQKFVYPFDTLGDTSYMIMPRSMTDFGITSDNYDALRGLREDNFTTQTGGGSTDTGGGSTGGGSTGGGSSSTDKKATCFAKGSRIMTPNGFKSIESIEIGERVITFDMDLNLYERKVVRTYIHDKNESSDIYKYVFSDGTELNVTENHPFLTSQMEFVHIGDLNIGDRVMTKDKNTVEILSKEFVGNDTVYNIEVDEFNAYIVENICVHNLTKTAPNLDLIIESGPGLI